MNVNPKGIYTYIKLATSIVFVLILAVFGFLFLDIYRASTVSNAIQGCLESSFIRTQAENFEKQEPSFYVYTLCIKDKGLQTTFKDQ